jgi:hypothetical protein
MYCCYHTPSLYAQRFSERFFILNPLQQYVSNPAGELLWMPTFQGWGGFNGYAFIKDDEHAWRNELGGLAEILRIGNTASLAIVSVFEHVANDKNDISFNPRAIWWEEGLVWTQRADSMPLSPFWQLGYYHRCKHEIDNLLDSQTERVLIYGSLTGKYIVHVPIGLHYALLALRGDVFTIYRDYRTPRQFEAVPPSYNHLLASVGANFHYHAALPVKQLGWYAKSYARLTAFGATEGFLERFRRVERIVAAFGLAVGLAVESAGAGGSRLEFGVNYEYLPDPEIKIFPSPQHLLFFGFTLTSPQIW